MQQKQNLLAKDFPFSELSVIAEQESWRKEVNRPTSYIHKWWARRLGSNFRGLIIAGNEYEKDSFFKKFYLSTCYPNTTVFDPFMGSGTTITEAVKLGTKVVGCDINPVAAAIVRTSLTAYNREAVQRTYKQIEAKCADKIRHFYVGILDGKKVDVLYYFWVKEAVCRKCGARIPLFRNTVFSKNAYPAKKPQAQSVCPCCGNINRIRYNDTSIKCSSCEVVYNPQLGNIDGNYHVCPKCGAREKTVDYARRTGEIIHERLFAKLVIDKEGVKHYLPIDEYDLALFQEADSLLENYSTYIPDDEIIDGINTKQIINYQYHNWRDMFNSRQLLAFGILSQAIMEIEDINLRRLFAMLMSGTLEFNNMFCSYKGEGTGAVRPLFYNHILKNELMPLEGNVWGCRASSGSFSTLFERRVLKMLDYKEQPFELRVTSAGRSEKVSLSNSSIETNPTTNIDNWTSKSPLILCGDSANTGLPEECIDFVITDPPFFDNVNYSELADFFYVWLRKMDAGIDLRPEATTRRPEEVQDNDSEKFASKLSDVFKESHRVLRRSGKLVFTYHHSRTDGWISVYNAISSAGYIIEEVFPLKAEMAVSVAIMAAKEPINYDLVFVCEKAENWTGQIGIEQIAVEYNEDLRHLEECKLKFSKGDELVLLHGLSLKYLSQNSKEITRKEIEKIIQFITTGQGEQLSF